APDIMKALVAAKKRGVDVKIVIDERGNTGRASIAAMNYIANSGIPLRTDSDFPIQHDKVIIVDNVTVETGSFNFTKAAETKNSENAVVIWNMPKLAESFLEHWQDRWNRGRDYRSSY
ncbi:phospholipase D family protein, partial [Pluralibacter gergoviae]|nr:phospholipase D family protein [Pluralibacter gergoviae]ELK5596464.1 phospholipase D family protein [Pluralibacter gergoviae]